MNDRNKKPDDRFSIVKGFLRENFEIARKNVHEGMEVASAELRSTLKTGEKITGEAYAYVEKTVGKERVIGAAVGAKVGGTIGLGAGIPGMIVMGTAGAMVGLVSGRKFIQWYRNDEINDNPIPPYSQSNPNDPAP